MILQTAWRFQLRRIFSWFRGWKVLDARWYSACLVGWVPVLVNCFFLKCVYFFMEMLCTQHSSWLMSVNVWNWRTVDLLRWKHWLVLETSWWLTRSQIGLPRNIPLRRRSWVPNPTPRTAMLKIGRTLSHAKKKGIAGDIFTCPGFKS